MQPSRRRRFIYASEEGRASEAGNGAESRNIHSGLSQWTKENGTRRDAKSEPRRVDAQARVVRSGLPPAERLTLSSLDARANER